MSPHEFFETHLPLALAASEAPDAEGVLAFAVIGAGEWTVDLKTQVITPSFNDKADFTLRMPSADFEAMVAGDFDADAAVLAGRMQAQGNLKLLAAFGLLIEPRIEETLA